MNNSRAGWGSTIFCCRYTENVITYLFRIPLYYGGSIWVKNTGRTGSIAWFREGRSGWNRSWLRRPICRTASEFCASDQKSRRNNYLRNLEFSSKTNRFMRFASCVNFGKGLAHISMSRFAWMAKSICSTYLIIKVISTEIKIDTGEFYTIKKGQPGITCCPVKNMI